MTVLCNLSSVLNSTSCLTKLSYAQEELQYRIAQWGGFVAMIYTYKNLDVLCKKYNLKEFFKGRRLNMVINSIQRYLKEEKTNDSNCILFPKYNINNYRDLSTKINLNSLLKELEEIEFAESNKGKMPNNFRI